MSQIFKVSDSVKRETIEPDNTCYTSNGFEFIDFGEGLEPLDANDRETFADNLEIQAAIKEVAFDTGISLRPVFQTRTQFRNWQTASATEEEVDGQVFVRQLDFELDGLDYSFAFDPRSDDPREGATLTYVGNSEEGSMAPSKYADARAWAVASRICY